MKWKKQLRKTLDMFIGALIGLMVYAWIAKGSPFLVDWAFGAAMFAALIVGRSIRILSERSENKEPNE